MRGKLSSAVWGLVGVLVGATIVGVGSAQQEDEVDPRLLRACVQWVVEKRLDEYFAREKRYPWMPEELREPAVITEGEWDLLEVAATPPYGGFQYLCFAGWHVLVYGGENGGVSANIVCEHQSGRAPAWEALNDRQKRAEFERLARLVLPHLTLFEQLRTDRVIITFSVMGEQAEAASHDGKVVLAGEPGFNDLTGAPPKFTK